MAIGPQLSGKDSGCKAGGDSVEETTLSRPQVAGCGLDFWAKQQQSKLRFQVVESSIQLKIFSGNANRPLAQRIADYIGVPLGDASVTSFPDEETFVKINENIRGRDIFIVQPTNPPANRKRRASARLRRPI